MGFLCRIIVQFARDKIQSMSIFHSGTRSQSTRASPHSCASSFKVYWRKDKLAPAGGFNASVDVGLKSLATSSISSGWKDIFIGGTNLINAYATDRLKFTMMYDNSEKKYRQFLSENRSMNRLWSFSNAAGLMAMFFEGYEY